MNRKTNAPGLVRVAEYRKILASLPDEAVGVVVACFMLSSLSQKRRFAKAMIRFEQQPGFAGWTTVRSAPVAGEHAVKVGMPASSRDRATARRGR